jgi:mitogen-activated protein kinase kinase kinase
MAMLAPNAFAPSSGPGMSTGLPPMGMSRRVPTVTTTHGYHSPTNSDFSDDEDGGPDAVKYWNEDRVCEYLRSVKCGEYEKLFRRNHINGENLLELDKEVLKEMGIEKVGDRVRLFLGIKKLRTRAYANQRKRNRVSGGRGVCGGGGGGGCGGGEGCDEAVGCGARGGTSQRWSARNANRR